MEPGADGAGLMLLEVFDKYNLCLLRRPEVLLISAEKESSKHQHL